MEKKCETETQRLHIILPRSHVLTCMWTQNAGYFHSWILNFLTKVSSSFHLPKHAFQPKVWTNFLHQILQTQISPPPSFQVGLESQLADAITNLEIQRKHFGHFWSALVKLEDDSLNQFLCGYFLLILLADNKHMNTWINLTCLFNVFDDWPRIFMYEIF